MIRHARLRLYVGGAFSWLAPHHAVIPPSSPRSVKWGERIDRKQNSMMFRIHTVRVCAHRGYEIATNFIIQQRIANEPKINNIISYHIDGKRRLLYEYYSNGNNRTIYLKKSFYPYTTNSKIVSIVQISIV